MSNKQSSFSPDAENSQDEFVLVDTSHLTLGKCFYVLLFSFSFSTWLFVLDCLFSWLPYMGWKRNQTQNSVSFGLGLSVFCLDIIIGY